MNRTIHYFISQSSYLGILGICLLIVLILLLWLKSYKPTSGPAFNLCFFMYVINVFNCHLYFHIYGLTLPLKAKP